MKRYLLFLLIVLFITNIESVAFGSENTSYIAPDYSNTQNWLALPSSVSKKVDIFYIYPTAWHKIDKNEPNYCEINNPTMQAGTKLCFKVQATAFDSVGNIYSPFYRQVDAHYSLSKPIQEQDKFIAELPAKDVTNAFDYYIKNYNKGRPFILVSHSQGSAVALNLLSSYMKNNSSVYKRMVAAYVIGFPVTKDYLKQNRHLRFAKGANDIGVIISYNTEAPNVEGINPLLRPNAISINPITWTRKETLAPAEKNLGSLVFDADRKILSVQKFADARVDKNRGTVICSSVNQETLFPKNVTFPRGVYHSFDYPFYYCNLTENANNRVNVYFKKHKLKRD